MSEFSLNVFFWVGFITLIPPEADEILSEGTQPKVDVQQQVKGTPTNSNG